MSGSCNKISRRLAWEWSIANAIDYRGLLAELAPSSAEGML